MNSTASDVFRARALLSAEPLWISPGNIYLDPSTAIPQVVAVVPPGKALKAQEIISKYKFTLVVRIREAL